MIAFPQRADGGTAIDDDAVTLKEIVKDATGDWVERAAKLELQESQENKK